MWSRKTDVIGSCDLCYRAATSSNVVFRFGGEEFVILLSDTDLAGAELLAERIRNTIEFHTLAYDMQPSR
jgi:PleD family two-component response regulator